MAWLCSGSIDCSSDLSQLPVESPRTCPTLSFLLYLPSTSSHSRSLAITYAVWSVFVNRGGAGFKNVFLYRLNMFCWTLRRVSLSSESAGRATFTLTSCSARRNVIYIGFKCLSAINILFQRTFAPSQDCSWKYPDYSEIYATWKDYSLPEPAVKTWHINANAVLLRELKYQHNFSRSSVYTASCCCARVSITGDAVAIRYTLSAQ